MKKDSVLLTALLVLLALPIVRYLARSLKFPGKADDDDWSSRIDHKNPAVRQAAVEELLGALANGDENVRRRAAYWLGRAHRSQTVFLALSNSLRNDEQASV